MNLSRVVMARQMWHDVLMPKRSSKRDFAQNALRVVEEAIGDSLSHKGKNPAAVALGRKGGMKGGKARAEKLSPERRKEIAQRAAAKRWSTN